MDVPLPASCCLPPAVRSVARAARRLIGGGHQEAGSARSSAARTQYLLLHGKYTLPAFRRQVLAVWQSQAKSAVVASVSVASNIPEKQRRGHSCEDGCLQTGLDPPWRELLEPGESLLRLVRCGPK